MKNPRGIKDIYLALAAALLGSLFYIKIIYGYWHYDDPTALEYAITHPILDMFFIPSEWRPYSASNFTPIGTMFFKLNYILFDLNQKAFYLSQLIIIFTTLTSLYMLCRKFMDNISSTIFILIFSTGVPFFNVAENLMTNHYLIGLLFSCMAINIYTSEIIKNKGIKLFLASLLYLFACLSKEIFVLLPILIFSIPYSDTKAKRFLIFGLLSTFLLYLSWRFYMLGTILGSSTSAYDRSFNFTLIENFLHSILQFNSFLFGKLWPIAAIIFFYAIAYSIIKLKNFWKILIGASLAALIPIIPLTNNPGIYSSPRYIMIPWLLFSLSIAFYFSASRSLNKKSQASELTLKNKGWKKISQITPFIILLLFILISISSHINFRSLQDNSYHEFESQGLFVNTKNSNFSYIPSPVLLGNFWYLNSLCNIKKMHGLGECPLPIIPGMPLEHEPEKIFAYDARTQSMTDVSFIKNQLIEDAKLIDMHAPLSAKLSRRDGQIFWEFGPYTEGQYFVVSPELGRLSMSASGSIATETRSYIFYVQYLAPTGILTSSPRLQLPAEGEVQWERP